MPKWGRKRPRRLIFLVGLYTVGAGLYDMVYPAITQNNRDKHNLRERYGINTWVVISGATNQLGQEFTQELSKHGFNVVIVDESQEKLNGLKSQIASSGVDSKIETIQFDLKKC